MKERDVAEVYKTPSRMLSMWAKVLCPRGFEILAVVLESNLYQSVCSRNPHVASVSRLPNTIASTCGAGVSNIIALGCGPAP